MMRTAANTPRPTRPAERDNERPDPERYRPEEDGDQRIDEAVEEEIRRGNTVVGEPEHEQTAPAREQDDEAAHG